MMSRPANELTALDAIESIRAGTLTSAELVEACLERIAAREETVGAWEWLDPDQARAAARRADAEPAKGPLHGLPVAVKDIFDTADMPTAYGSPIYAGHQPAADASSVSLARSAGAVMLGKTVSTEFAYFEPGKTANPHNPAHTPGGSSSGSSAAVADFMAPLAFGSQTVGSIIRPASYCGIAGYKPSYGLINRTGMRPLAETFDTPGVLARTAADAAFFVSVLSGRPGLRLDDPLPAAPAIGLCRTHEWSHADTQGTAALERAAELAEEAGARIREIELPESFAAIGNAQGTIVDFEASRAAAYELAVHPDRLSDLFRKRAEAGRATASEQYDAACDAVSDAQAQLPAIMDDVDALLCPSAPGEAPEGLGSTGNPVFNRLATALRAPAVNVPGLSGQSGLPIGVQIVGRSRDDKRTLAVADWLQNVLQKG